MSEPVQQETATGTNDDKVQDNKNQNTASVMPLDWTKLSSEPCEIINLPRDVCEYSSDETELAIIGTHGVKITKMGSDLSSTCPNLNTLILRSHIIHKMEGLNFEQLELLELYDNSIEKLEGLESLGSTLRVLDMSYNVIRDMEPVKLCPNLQELYLAQNKLKSMSGLRHLTKLRKIDLGANRIRIMDGEELSGLTNLEELWLGKNKIEKIEGLEKLTKLRRLDVQANRLTSIDNLTTQIPTLEELYLSHNAITDEGAAVSFAHTTFPLLTVLDLSRNRLASTQSFVTLTSLEELWMSGNQISSFESVAHIGGGTLSCLEGIYLEYNPVAEEFEYRKKLKEMIPSLRQIDADAIVSVLGGGGGSGGGKVESLEEKMRRMQQAAFDRACVQEKKRDAS